MHRMLLLAITLTLATKAPAQLAPPSCSDFNDNTVQGWTVSAATIMVDLGGPAGAADPYARCGDLPSGPASRIIAPNTFYGDWVAAGVRGICYDYIVHEDGHLDTQLVRPNIILLDHPSSSGAIRAVFRINDASRVTEPGGSNPGWHHFVAPTPTVTSLPLPSNSLGSWEIIDGTGAGDVADWNALLSNVQRVEFSADIAGSPSQDEDFGIDNICLNECGLTECCDPCDLAHLLAPLLPGGPTLPSTHLCFDAPAPDPPSDTCCETLATVLPGAPSLPTTHPCFTAPGPPPIQQLNAQPRPRMNMLQRRP